jgi:hypothetical protein
MRLLFAIQQLQNVLSRRAWCSLEQSSPNNFEEGLKGLWKATK